MREQAQRFGGMLGRFRGGLPGCRLRVPAVTRGQNRGRPGIQWQARAVASPDVDALDLQSAALLCEAAYRTHFNGELDGHMSSVRALLSRAAVQDLTVHVAGDQRYVVSHGPDAVYVAFQGTKHLADWAANLSFRHAPLWQRDGGADERPAAHGGFSARSMSLPLLELRAQARAAGKRLVLCGHSLGGAVAMIGAVTLLREAAAAAAAAGGGGDGAAEAGRGGGGGADGGFDCGAEAGWGSDPQIRCVTFAAPPVANEALAAEVAAAGWDRYIANFVLPEDPVIPVVNRLLRADSNGGAEEQQQEPQRQEAAAQQQQQGEEQQRAPREAGERTGGAEAAAAALERLLPRQLLILEDAAASAWRDDEGEAAGPDAWAWGGAAPHGAAAALVTAATGYVALGGHGRARSGRELQLHGRRAARLVRWAHDPRLAAQLRHYQRPGVHGHAPLPRARAAPWQQAAAGAACGRGRGGGGDGWGAAWAGLVLELQAVAAAAASAGASAGGAGPGDEEAPPSRRPARRGTSGGGAIAAARAFARAALGGGPLRRGLRAAALAAPRALASAAPAALARLLPAAVGFDVLASAVIAAVVPRTRPIGTQWVLTHEGPQPAGRPARAYPQQPAALGLGELGGLFPGHRMVAYRNRVAQLGGAPPLDSLAGREDAEAAAAADAAAAARRPHSTDGGGGGAAGGALSVATA
ncbi:hypothetical protein Rsub_09214 [Raphidocelis subcapitata]|uniref:Fungal lipase-type domain-containing protein n=1 Tax=Raphidocelis subcapitata TaxID=307507 RepID=A0A2V0PH99_9CHLO|nr:hypothetical protein Rsub_09214 [Raphidocelis subcapitata]|eukprot:GBF96415.1 hypothetical protein Rsub_09214 [Raphidocelis subcapitata]